MSSGASPGETPPPKASGSSSKPDWADGLRQLYDSVVDEPLPDSFKDLLEKLDEPEEEQGGSAHGGPEGPRD